MTPGEKTVILVRAMSLSDALTVLLGRPTLARMEEAAWDAQRLASTCDRVLGTRDRPTDRLRKKLQDG